MLSYKKNQFYFQNIKKLNINADKKNLYACLKSPPNLESLIIRSQTKIDLCDMEGINLNGLQYLEIVGNFRGIEELLGLHPISKNFHSVWVG
ncbi:MAG UNVERIFIED_CONTAM: hypothetical protein LVQ98_05815 [Rickettsiaceae bacterium]|jgi:hypothetical protein